MLNEDMELSNGLLLKFIVFTELSNGLLLTFIIGVFLSGQSDRIEILFGP